MATLLYQGHGSYRITSDNGIVVYVDPYAGTGYDVPADLVIVTHEHNDHNNTQLVTLKKGGVIIRHADLHKKNYSIYNYKNIIIEGVPAMNAHHNPDDCVGFIMDIDGIRIYGAGDTSYFEDMKYFKNLDYAILPTDGIYNMDMAEASRVADLLDTKYAIPVHMAPGHLFDDEKVKAFKTKKALVLKPGQEITLGA